MSAELDAQAAIAALYNHRQVVVGAHINDRGTIRDSEDTNAAITALKKHRLVWYHPEDEAAQLNGALSQMLDHSLRNFRRQMASEVISSILENLQNHLVVDYLETKKRCLRQDQERLKTEITECIYDLIDRLTQSVTIFAQYLSSGFTYVTDLELRLRENQRVIRMGEKLNDVLKEFDMEELDQLAGSDEDLRKLLSRTLPRYIELVQTELVNTLHQLTALLNSTREGAKRSRLIGAFERAYGNDKGFEPSIDGLVNIPPILNLVHNQLILPWVNPDDASAEVVLAGYCQGLVKPQETNKDYEETPVTIEDATELPSIELIPDPIVSAADDLIQCVLLDGLQTTASQSLLALEIDCPMSLWMGVLMNCIHSLSSEKRNCLKVRFIEENNSFYPDNYSVYDVVLGPKL